NHYEEYAKHFTHAGLSAANFSRLSIYIREVQFKNGDIWVNGQSLTPDPDHPGKYKKVAIAIPPRKARMVNASNRAVTCWNQSGETTSWLCSDNHSVGGHWTTTCNFPSQVCYFQDLPEAYQVTSGWDRKLNSYPCYDDFGGNCNCCIKSVWDINV